MWAVMGCAAAVVWALAGVANLPRASHPATPAVALSVAIAIAFAYWCGTRRARGRAVASAVARAEATAVAAVTARTTSASTAQSNVQVFLPDPRYSAVVAGESLGLENAPWMVGAHRAAELDEQEALLTALEDVQELSDDYDTR